MRIVIVNIMLIVLEKSDKRLDKAQSVPFANQPYLRGLKALPIVKLFQIILVHLIAVNIKTNTVLPEQI
jgi:hypothetical protein